MAVKIRLARLGQKKRPFYRIVVADIEAPRNGRFLEVVGTYDPLQDPPKVDLKVDAIKGWMEKGARPTDTVGQIFKRSGALEAGGEEASA